MLALHLQKFLALILKTAQPEAQPVNYIFDKIYMYWQLR